MPNDELGDISLFRLHKLERNEELVFRFHQFIREKCFEHQNKFDRTLVFLSSGAIVLAYSLFDTVTTRSSWYFLFLAMLLWAATFIVSLVEYMLNIRKSLQYLAQFGEVSIVALRQHTVEDTIKTLHGFIERLKKDTKLSKSKKLTEALSSFVVQLKNDTAPRHKLLQTSAETSFAYAEPHTTWNIWLLCLLIGGCMSFAVFTCLERIDNVAPKTTEPSATIQTCAVIDDDTNAIKNDENAIEVNQPEEPDKTSEIGETPRDEQVPPTNDTKP